MCNDMPFISQFHSTVQVKLLNETATNIAISWQSMQISFPSLSIVQLRITFWVEVISSLYLIAYEIVKEFN